MIWLQTLNILFNFEYVETGGKRAGDEMGKEKHAANQ